MKIVNIYKAQRKPAIEFTRINLCEEIPRFEGVEVSQQIFEKEALTLADTLCETLPGGTLDRLMVELMRRSVFASYPNARGNIFHRTFVRQINEEE